MKSILELLILCALQLLGAVAIGPQLSVTWRDCNISKHSRITDVTPDFMGLGSKIPITVRGEVDKEIEDGTFSINTQSMWMKALLDVMLNNTVPSCPTPFACWTEPMPVLANCSGDASRQVHSETRSPCFLGGMAGWAGGMGWTAFNGLDFPISAGNLDISLDFFLPHHMGLEWVQETTTEVTSVAENGEKVFCVRVVAGRSVESGIVPLSYEDCGDSQTRTRVTGMYPTSAKRGVTTRIVLKGSVDKDIASSKGSYKLVSRWSHGDFADCSGDAAESKKCHMNLFSPLLPVLGSIEFNAMRFPIQKGPMSVNLDLWLNPLIPTPWAETTTRVMGSTKRGEVFFCVDIATAPILPPHATVASPRLPGSAAVLV
jgi:hypothetical protein